MSNTIDAVDAELVDVAATGALFVAPKGTALPTSGSDPLNELFRNVGYISPEGIQFNEPTSQELIRAWQRNATVRVVQTEHDFTFGFTMLETNAVVIETYHGNYNAGGWDIDGRQLPELAWVLEYVDRDMLRRAIVPVGQISDKGESAWTATAAVSRPVTVTALASPAGFKGRFFPPVPFDADQS